MLESTICAIATPIGMGSISIVRLSGKQSLNIATKIFSCNNKPIINRKAILGNFIYEGISDKCILIYFKSPFSFTGEDVVEFQVHGGTYLTQKVLQACLDNGAVLASKGEFSMRAFMNGKISLDEAEGIVDTINAESKSEILVGQRLQKGTLKVQIDSMQNTLTTLLAQINLSLDYPEHDDELKISTSVKKQMEKINQQLLNLIKTESAGKTIRNGIQVAIIGKPNVGKSSVLNALIGSERAIVSEIAGTTRDIVCETIEHQGIKIRFSDTAGIRDSSDVIEIMGIEKSKQEAENADVVLAIFDASCPLDNYDMQIMEITKNKKGIVVLNKSDKPNKLSLPNALVVSAKTGENILSIKNKIIKELTHSKIDLSGDVVVNMRHAEILNKAISLTNLIIEQSQFQTLDILSFQIKELWNIIGGITGKTDNEDIIDEIFSKFCLGK